jgi:8-oxo-dGTP diphosphatase
MRPRVQDQPIGYRVIAAALRKQIKNNTFGPGDRLPTEESLAKQFGVSRVTTNRALNMLVNEGLVVIRRGIGAFVAQPGAAADRHSVSVAAVIVDDQDRVLVVQRRDNGKWEIPGGVLELDESIYAGLRREVEEETGALIEPDWLSGVYKNLKLGVVALVFRAHIVGGEVGPTEESARVEWWTYDAVSAQMAETFAVRVVDAFDADRPIVRAHDGVRLLAE